MSNKTSARPIFMLTEADIIELMRQRDVMPTQQRVEIAQILFEMPQHLSADQVLGRVNHQQNLVSKATVYNTLKLFAARGLIREVIVDPTKVFYDSSNVPHHHFYNIDTGLLTDIASDNVQISQLPRLPPGTVAEGVDVIVRIRNQSG